MCKYNVALLVLLVTLSKQVYHPITKLLSAKRNLSEKKKPRWKSKMWRLNQRIAESKLFGQYVAEVFFNVQ